LADAWRDEDKDALFLYLHVPYCEMRCAFCNLFARSQPSPAELTEYTGAVRRQAARVRKALGSARFARMAVGGGTPTFLGASGLEQLLDTLAETLGVDPRSVVTSVETSPGTSSSAVLEFLRARGVRRASIGVQSFVEAELRSIGRPALPAESRAALDRLRRDGPPVLNVDLMYGLPDQTAQSWRYSLDSALEYRPEEIYAYPLYVREQTPLSRRTSADDAHRRQLYRVGRDRLLESGYVQESMRMFRRGISAVSPAPEYSCQDDGMVGLGCGARSYTRELHYSSRYAVAPAAVRDILRDWVAAPDAAFDVATWGIRLPEMEQRRRWLLKGLLRAVGLDCGLYRRRFHADVTEDFPALLQLEEHGLAVPGDASWHLSEEGLELADAIGPWLYSTEVRDLMNCTEPR
jgi:oxygen-independent coproporphyrinogen-3 oxidase